METDVVVIGSGIGGLSCACVLAKYGFNVVICESHSIPGGAAHSFERQGFKFDSGPSLHSGLSVSPSTNPLRQVLDIIDEDLNFDYHINTVVNKANKTLDVIKRTLVHCDKEIILHLYKSLVHPILEYANVIWNPYLKRQVNKIENIQRRTTKLIPELTNKSYDERLQHLNLPSLAYRRIRGDLIQVFKIFNKTCKNA